jgi:hypothetical protein
MSFAERVETALSSERAVLSASSPSISTYATPAIASS